MYSKMPTEFFFQALDGQLGRIFLNHPHTHDGFLKSVIHEAVESLITSLS